MEKRLFCFSFAGGGPSSFNLLKKELGSQIEIIGVPYPGREKLIVKKSFEDIYDLASYCSDYILQNQSNSELSFLGHCFGGRVAFETAKILRERNIYVENIFLSATSSPNNEGPKLSHLNDDELLKNITNLTNYETPSWKFDELRRLQLPSLRSDVIADENYKLDLSNLRKIKTSKLIIVDAKDDQYISADKTKDWKLWASVCKEIQVDGEHMYLLTEKGSEQLSKIILNELGVNTN